MDESIAKGLTKRMLRYLSEENSNFSSSLRGWLDTKSTKKSYKSAQSLADFLCQKHSHLLVHSCSFGKRNKRKHGLTYLRNGDLNPSLNWKERILFPHQIIVGSQGIEDHHSIKWMISHHAVQRWLQRSSIGADLEQVKDAELMSALTDELVYIPITSFALGGLQIEPRHVGKRFKLTVAGKTGAFRCQFTPSEIEEGRKVLALDVRTYLAEQMLTNTEQLAVASQRSRLELYVPSHIPYNFRQKPFQGADDPSSRAERLILELMVGDIRSNAQETYLIEDQDLCELLIEWYSTFPLNDELVNFSREVIGQKGWVAGYNILLNLFRKEFVKQKNKN